MICDSTLTDLHDEAAYIGYVFMEIKNIINKAFHTTDSYIKTETVQRVESCENEPCHEKACLRGFRPSYKILERLSSYRR